MQQPVRMIGAPTDYGANRRGVDMGPSAIRYAGLAEQLEATGISVIDSGDIDAPRAEVSDPHTHPPASGNAKFLNETEAFCRSLTKAVRESLAAEQFPIVLGGDHSVAIGSLNGSAKDSDIGVVWFDAHTDLNTPETSPSGNVYGMGLAAALGYGAFEGVEWATVEGLKAENIALVGLRSVDEPEKQRIKNSEISVFTMADIDNRGITAVTDAALSAATDGVD